MSLTKRTTAALFVATFAGFLHGQTRPQELAPIVITAGRTEWSTESSPFSTQIVAGDSLVRGPAFTLDQALRSVPAFSLFRRSDSFTAHPTAQGVSLRGLGPSGASRSLVLLDGIPLNDPFGGWVSWAKLPREGLSRAELVSGGGATAWGNAALGGVIQLVREPVSVAPRLRLSAQAGDFHTGSGEAVARVGGPASGFEISGRWFSTHGYLLVAPESLGPIDRPAGSRHHLLGARWEGAVGHGLRAGAEVRWFDEHRENGTPYTGNSTEDLFASAFVSGTFGAEVGWRAVAYMEDETFTSTFSAVNAARSAETPASEQYDVPSSAAGAAVTAEWGDGVYSRTVTGLDVRGVRGESRERYLFSEGAFTRSRSAGGEQATAGIFLLHQQQLAKTVDVTLGSRLDYWTDRDGFRVERDLLSGDSLRDERFDGHDGWVWSPSGGVVWLVTPELRWRTSAQRAFRRPTLNELYRPFRVGSVITEANAGLGTETVTTVETAVNWSRGPVSTEVAAFWNELDGAVSNVTVARGPGNVPGFGFIPAGGIGRRRENLDRVRVRGIDANAQWQVTPAFSLNGGLLLNDAEVTKAAAAPALEGRRLAQVPRVTAVAGLEWKHKAWRIAPRLRWMGAQFEDDENSLRLAPALVCDATAGWTVSPGAEVFVTAENVFNERIETGRSTTSVINVGTPRFVTGGVRLAW